MASLFPILLKNWGKLSAVSVITATQHLALDTSTITAKAINCSVDTISFVSNQFQ